VILCSLALAASPELTLGSYGRVEASSLTDGGHGEPVVFTAWPGRLDSDPYLELDFGWRLQADDGTTFRALVTPALSGELFHSSGDFDAALAVRNLYAEAAALGGTGIGVWAGSRMLRGDDVYLLDLWPLDNLNTVGGGASWLGPTNEVSVHVGMNRLDGESWQFQQVEVPAPGGVEAETVTVLDRQKVVASLRGSHTFGRGDVHVRPRLYGELHHLPAGTRYTDLDSGATEILPAERGGLVGLQLSAWGWADESFVHLSYRHASGIAAVGELTVPTDGFALDGSVGASRSDLVALGGNQQLGRFSVAVGSYVRGWRDADGQAVDVDDGWEWVWAVRPGVGVGRYGALQVELSRQWLRPNGLNVVSAEWDRPAATQLSLLPGVQWKPGTYGRPRIHLRYSLVLLNQDAVDWLGTSRFETVEPVQHRLGLGAEWWINSQSYR